MQGPEQYLNELGVTLTCAVDPSRPAVLDTAHRALVNYEAYYVSDDDAMHQFRTAPYRYTGKVTDPVSMERFVPTASSPVRSFGDRLFYFSSVENANVFDSDSLRYGTPMPAMKPRKDET